MLDEQSASGRGRGRPGDGSAADDDGPLLVDPDTGRPRKFAYAPGLVVVDGGPPQVAAAQQALAELGIVDIPVCGLAKRLEEVWLPDQDDPVVLPRTQRGALPAAARARRGAPVRDRPPPAAAVASRWSRACSTRCPGSARSGARRC